jgi:hypothetical protein
VAKTCGNSSYDFEVSAPGHHERRQSGPRSAGRKGATSDAKGEGKRAAATNASAAATRTPAQPSPGAPHACQTQMP